MFRRALPLIGLAAALSFAAPGQSAQDAGVLVRVRVEGKTSTIFGASQPRALATTPMDALEAASKTGEFYYHVRKTDFGPYVDQIGRYAEDIPGASGWAFKVNGASPPVGADTLQLEAGDVVLWYWATFSNAGGPSTLELTRTANGCYRVSAKNDAGDAVSVTATLKVDGRRVAVREGNACPGSHKSLVRAVAPGAVRSNVLP